MFKTFSLLMIAASGSAQLENIRLCEGLLANLMATGQQVQEVNRDRRRLSLSENESNVLEIRAAEKVLKNRALQLDKEFSDSWNALSEVPFLKKRIHALERANTAILLASFEAPTPEREICEP